MDVEYEITADDTFAYLMYVNQSNQKPRQEFIATYIFPLCSIALAIYLFLREDNRPFIGILLLLFGAVCFYLPKLQKRNLMINANSASSKTRGKICSSMTDEYLVVTGENTKIEFKWGYFESYSETPEHLFLFILPNQALIIPKNSLKPTDLAMAWVEQIKLKIPNSPHPPKPTLSADQIKNIKNNRAKFFVIALLIGSVLPIVNMIEDVFPVGKDFDAQKHYAELEQNLYADKNYIVRIKIDKLKVMVGEPISVRINLIRPFSNDGNRCDLYFNENPSAPGMKIENSNDAKKLSRKEKKIGRDKILDEDVLLTQLISNEPGTYTYAPGKFKLVINEKTDEEVALDLRNLDYPINLIVFPKNKSKN